MCPYTHEGRQLLYSLAGIRRRTINSMARLNTRMRGSCSEDSRRQHDLGTNWEGTSISM